MISTHLSEKLLPFSVYWPSPKWVKAGSYETFLEETCLDTNELKNFRPVSNLPFISKILEKVVLLQLQFHLSMNNLLEIQQSAYRKKSQHRNYRFECP